MTQDVVNVIKPGAGGGEGAPAGGPEAADPSAAAPGISKHMRLAEWLARIAVALVFVVNVQCAVSFILWPENFLGAYGLEGTTGQVALQGLGVAFLMWNTTYPLVIWKPGKHRTLFGIVLVQQLVGIVGESLIVAQLDPVLYATLVGSINRFISFDVMGLILMGGTFIGMAIALRADRRASRIARGRR